MQSGVGSKTRRCVADSLTGFVSHAGIYEGNASFFHAPSTGDVLKSSSLNEPFYAGRFAGGRRMPG